MKLASIETIAEKSVHPNADLLEIVHILGFKCIVKKSDNFQVGQKVVFVQPDTVLPDAPWAAFYKAKSNRVKAIRLRNIWSEGIVEKLENVGILPSSEGEVSELLGIVKWEPPVPQDLQAKGNLPFGIPKTDEERYENLEKVPYGEEVDVTMKLDGRSATLYVVKVDGEWFTGICGRTMEYKLDSPNCYTKFQNYLPKLLEIAKTANKSLAVRGEICGAGIQASKHNPSAIGPQQLYLFSTYLVDERRYVNRNEREYPWNGLSDILGLPTCEMLEKGVILTPELIKKYSEDLTAINGKLFEGIVIKTNSGFSFKVINKYYDSKK